VLDDVHLGRQQDRVRGPARVGHVVDVDRVDSDEDGPVCDQPLRSGAR
jgi:hypothetical protein